MRIGRSRRVNSLLNWAIKGTISALLLFAIYRQVFESASMPSLLEAWQELNWQQQWPYLAFVLLLLPANWALESLKWQALLAPFWKIPFGKALRAILAGVSVSLFTPNRVGEYGGRVLAVPARYNWQALMATLVGNYAQLLVLLSGGLLGAIHLIGEYQENWRWLTDGLWWLSLAFLAVAYFFFFNMHWLAGAVRLLPLPRKMLRFFLMICQYEPRQLSLAIGLAALRYGIYCTQYYLLALFFGIEAPAGAAFAGIATIFLIQASVPLPPVIGLLARGEAALAIWGQFSDNELAILAATFALFIINLCLPSLLGMAFIVKINVLKSLGYETEVFENESIKQLADSSHGFHSTRKP